MVMALVAESPSTFLQWLGPAITATMFNAGRIGIQGGQDAIPVRTDPGSVHFQD